MSDIIKLEKRINSLKESVNQELGKYKNLLDSKKKQEQKIKEMDNKKKKLDKSKQIAMKSAEYKRKQKLAEFQEMVSNGLKYVYEKNYSLEFLSKKQRGHIECNPKIRETVNGISSDYNINQGSGDGLFDVSTLSFNMAQLESLPKNNKGFLILDEPVRQVHGTNITKVGNFIKEISKNFNRQMIVITHNEALATLGNKVFYVEKKDNTSFVQTIKDVEIEK
ncbi:MAG: hypothetical protein ACOCRX_04880 [Candidatus Woesearchaeota archaeon]